MKKTFNLSDGDNLGEFLKSERISNGLSIEEMSKKSNISIKAINNIEIGDSSNIKMKDLIKYCQAIDLKLDFDFV